MKKEREEEKKHTIRKQRGRTRVSAAFIGQLQRRVARPRIRQRGDSRRVSSATLVDILNCRASNKDNTRTLLYKLIECRPGDFPSSGQSDESPAAFSNFFRAGRRKRRVATFVNLSHYLIRGFLRARGASPSSPPAFPTCLSSRSASRARSIDSYLATYLATSAVTLTQASDQFSAIMLARSRSCHVP